jgi:sn-glycerol 3-phosphate transport system ATP-binding protein
MRLEIKALQRDLGITSLYVTHDQVEAMTLADRMIVMNDGVAEQIGAPIEVYEQPQTQFVAGFIGSPAMNFFSPGLLAGTGDGPGPVGVAASLGIRPEHAVLCAAEDAILTGRVAYIEALGSEMLIHLSLENADMFTVRTAESGSPPAVGTMFGLRWPLQQLMAFDRAGRRLPPHL